MKSFKHKTIEVRMQGAFLRFLFKETIISRPAYFYFLDTLGVLGRHSGAKDISSTVYYIVLYICT